MPLVIPTGFSQITLDFRIPAPGGSKVASTTFGVGAPPAASDLTTICDQWALTVWSLLGSDQCTFLGGSMRDALFTYEDVRSEDGTKTLELPPPNVTLLVKKVTNGAGRKNRGRMYPPGMVYETTYDATGQMSESDAGDYTDILDDFRQWCNDEGYDMHILHTDETAPTAVQNLVADRTAATQRRRLR